MDGTIPTNDDAAERKDKQPTAEEDERRCDAVAQLLLEGKKARSLRRPYPTYEFHREMKMGYLRFDGASRRNSCDMELGYDSRGSSPMLSVTPSSTAPSVLYMPLPMYVPPMNFYGMNRPSSVPLPIPMFFGSYSAPGIALPSLPTLSRFVSPVGSITRHTQQHHQCLLQPFHNPFERVHDHLFHACRTLSMGFLYFSGHPTHLASRVSGTTTE